MIRERRKIIDRWHRGDGSVLATLFRVHGSSYRQPGARLLTCKDGSYEGSISGGCLEADLVRKAAWLVRDGASVQQYSTIFDAATETPFGLGCGGVLDLLLEPIETPEAQVMLTALENHLQGEELLVATWLPTASMNLMRAIIDAKGDLRFASPELPEGSIAQACRASREAHAPHMEGVLLERLVPPQRLFIFGAGDDAKPLVTMASLLGWSVTVTDSRSHFAHTLRFPERHVTVSPSPREVLQQISSRDAVVVMTHSFEQDRDYLTALLRIQPKYLGLLGSRQRSSLLIDEAATTLGLSIAECCELLSAPIGLDIGGEGPEGIALAIIAEAQAACSGKVQAREKLSAARVQMYLADSGDITLAECRAAERLLNTI